LDAFDPARRLLLFLRGFLAYWALFETGRAQLSRSGKVGRVWISNLRTCRSGPAIFFKTNRLMVVRVLSILSSFANRP
jgi:hypothetical protein